MSMSTRNLAAVAAAMLLAFSSNLRAQGLNSPPIGAQGGATQLLTFDGQASDQNACWGYGGGYSYGGWGGSYYGGGYYGGYRPYYYSSYSYSPYYYSYPSYGYSSYYPYYGSYGGYYGGYGYGYGGYGGYYPYRGYSYWGPCNGSAVAFERDWPQPANVPQASAGMAQPQAAPFGLQAIPQQQQAPAANSQPNVAPRQTVPLQGRFVSLGDVNQPAENLQTRDLPLVFVPQR